MTPEEYLKKPYTFQFRYDKDSDTWTGTVKEFPGCVGQFDDDDTDEISGMWNIARDWIVATLYFGQEIPEPEGDTGPEGGVTNGIL
jgi:hypothetical protein